MASHGREIFFVILCIRMVLLHIKATRSPSAGLRHVDYYGNGITLIPVRSCRGRAIKTFDFHTGGSRFEPRPGSSTLGQGALSSLPSLSEDTLSRRSRV